MKNLVLMMCAIVGVASAQNQPAMRKNDDARLTSEQRTALQVKKLTLELGLNETQQKEMSAIIAEQNAEREALSAEMKAAKANGAKPTADQRYARHNQMLDAQIAMKERVRKVLTKEQFEKWEKIRERRMAKMSERRGSRKMHQNDRK